MLELALRALRYRGVDSDPAIRARTDFFAAAALVTQAISRIRPSGFLLGLSAQLERLNMHRATAIRLGTLYCDGSLAGNTDQFIHVEQCAVQQELDRLRRHSPGRYCAEVHCMNRALWLATRLPWLTGSDCVGRALVRAQQETGGRADFAAQRFREAVGRQIASSLRTRARAEAAAACIGHVTV